MTAFAPHPTDRALLARFVATAIGSDEWTHAMHVRMGWVHVKCFGLESAIELLRERIRRLNEANGVTNSPSEGYHETITRLWATLITAAAQQDGASIVTSAAFLERHPELLDQQLGFRHYRKATLMSEEARAGWVPPDLEPLPESG